MALQERLNLSWNFGFGDQEYLNHRIRPNVHRLFDRTVFHALEHTSMQIYYVGYPRLHLNHHGSIRKVIGDIDAITGIQSKLGLCPCFREIAANLGGVIHNPEPKRPMGWTFPPSAVFESTAAGILLVTLLKIIPSIRYAVRRQRVTKHLLVETAPIVG